MGTAPGLSGGRFLGLRAGFVWALTSKPVPAGEDGRGRTLGTDKKVALRVQGSELVYPRAFPPPLLVIGGIMWHSSPENPHAHSRCPPFVLYRFLPSLGSER